MTMSTLRKSMLNAYPRLALSALVFATTIAPTQLLSSSAQAQAFRVIYAFNGAAGDGIDPIGGLTRDKSGNLYGTTSAGGAYGLGTVYKLDKMGKESVLFNYTQSEGEFPTARITLDPAGNIYSTAETGGIYGGGTAIKIDTNGIETLLHSFGHAHDGADPFSYLLRTPSGTFIGTATYGGAHGYGTVFTMTEAGAEHSIYNFTGGVDGAYPIEGGLIQDPAGNIYGTTGAGGAFGAGTVFKLDKKGVETVLYSFAGGSDGSAPYAELLRDSAGNLYGTTAAGGPSDGGTVFKLDATNHETILHSFSGSPDGFYVIGGLVRDSAGNLYGTTVSGGNFGLGTVYKIDPTGTETILHHFTGGPDGEHPNDTLVITSTGVLYGTSSSTVFALHP